MKKEKTNFILKILNGLSIGVIIALVPGAILGSLMKIFANDPTALAIGQMTTLAQSLLAVIAAMAVGQAFKFSMIDTGSMALAAFMGSGAATVSPKGVFVLNGPGDIINIGVTLVIAVLLIQLLAGRLGQLKVILSPILLLAIAGGLGKLLLPYVHSITTSLGSAINDLTGLRPLIMGPLMGIVFAVLILSPISSVAIAMAIGLTGIGSGAANLGITTASFALAIMGSSVNSLGGTLSHFIGTPKVQMANMLSKPKLFIPIVIVSALAGLEGALLKVGGTAMSAGFGFSGLIGPLGAFATGTTNLFLLLLEFVMIPLVLAYSVHLLFVKKLHFIEPMDLKLPEAD
ncbi:PTS sugar transporter subunit IIC [Oenococcus sicerae]|uniref:PTS sugar transporter subunit IIC n=1 Tax=Oenococcus sicerae TaxID=2203724 RepID=A0AAJ1RE82_9LACO|nr:PTS sugar transporter subunit IIC [Oenococcus sicerae]MDN6900296.1 PTS sugar transporter subunit IIC [Oenococcus sicerae]QAS69872.1 PTS sugar transporter subunit IIC [Oenococcus sicerae]